MPRACTARAIVLALTVRLIRRGDNAAVAVVILNSWKVHPGSHGRTWVIRRLMSEAPCSHCRPHGPACFACRPEHSFCESVLLTARRRSGCSPGGCRCVTTG